MEPVGRRIDGVEKIAVLRCGGIGDLIFALPALAALRAAYPEAELTLIAGLWQERFLKGRGVVDRVVQAPAYQGVLPGDADATRQERFFGRMQAESFDLAVQMHGGGRHSNPFVRRLGARVSLGLKTPDAMALDINVPYVYLQPEVFRYLELVAAAGCAPVGLEPSLPVTESDLDLPEGLLRLFASGRPVVVIGPGASDARRRWPAECFGELCVRLLAEGMAVAVSGGPEDEPAARRIAEMAPGVVPVAGTLSLNQLAGLVSRAALFVGNDSGPLHLARAVGVPSVGIYWIGNVINAGGPTRSKHRPVASWRLECPACGANIVHASCEHVESFVGDVELEEVLFNALDLV